MTRLLGGATPKTGERSVSKWSEADGLTEPRAGPMVVIIRLRCRPALRGL